MKNETMLIGKVAARAGVNVQTLRYYERRGLLEEPDRTPSGQRAYAEDAVRRVRFIKRAQELGFSLAEIEELLRLRDDTTASCGEVLAATEAKIEDIDRKLRDLRRMKRALVLLASSCMRTGSSRQCPILEALDTNRKGRRR
jgi:MerR family mercuric resistance operon transcriptional regulator